MDSCEEDFRKGRIYSSKIVISILVRGTISFKLINIIKMAFDGVSGCQVVSGDVRGCQGCWMVLGVI